MEGRWGKAGVDFGVKRRQGGSEVRKVESEGESGEKRGIGGRCDLGEGEGEKLGGKGGIIQRV